MNNILKNQIIKAVQENITEFQLHNFIVAKFEDYIFTRDGKGYLIEGETIMKFINDFINLYTR